MIGKSVRSMVHAVASPDLTQLSNLRQDVVKEVVNFLLLCFGHLKTVSSYSALQTLFDDLQEIAGHLLGVSITLSQQTV